MYTRDSGRKRAIIFVFVIAGALLAAIWSRGGSEGIIGRTQRLMLATVAPAQKAVNAAISPFRRISQYTLVIGDLTAKNRELQRENMGLRRKNSKLKSYAAENKRLRLLAGFRNESQLKSVGARVIGRSPTSWQSIVTIDGGLENSIAENMAVITDKGLVGRTVRVSGAAALVQLLDDRRSGVGVEVSRTGATGVAEGSMDGRLRLKFMPADADVKGGDRLLTSGAGGVYPRGILVGTVASVSKTPYSLEQTIAVRPAVDFARLSEVLVITADSAPPQRL